MPSRVSTSLRRRFAAVILAVIFAVAGLPTAQVLATPDFTLPGVDVNHVDLTKRPYVYDDFDHLAETPPPPDLAAVQLGTLAQYRKMKAGTVEHLYARWKAYVDEQSVASWDTWRFAYLARNRLGRKLLSVGQPSEAALQEIIKPSQEYKTGSTEQLFAAWQEARERRADPNWKPPVWKEWLPRTLRAWDNRARGADGFENLVRVEYVEKEPSLKKITFRYGQSLPKSVRDKLSDELKNTRLKPDIADFDAVRVIFECKDKSTLTKREWTQLSVTLRVLKVINGRAVYIFSGRPDAATLSQMVKMAAEAGVPLEVRVYSAIAQKKSAMARSATPQAEPGLTPPGQYAADGAFKDMIDRSADSAADAALSESVAAAAEADLDTTEEPEDADQGVEPVDTDLGGVDFSTLQLNYVADSYNKGPGVQYAFSADKLAADQQSFGGRRNALLASDSFFVWLALRPDTFWVNLNPTEPDRIIDAEFGRTDAGRVLLEADLEMKKSVAKFIHPDTPGGKRYWDSLQGESRCTFTRQWIVPDTAVVRENGDELFILDAPLRVKMETDYSGASKSNVSACGDSTDPAVAKHNEKVYRDTILPQVQKAVNTAPEYADLRRVYASRVAAEWFRQRSKTKQTAVSDLVDTGDISRWTARDPWQPKEVFDRYVQSYTNGEFNVTHTTTAGNLIYTNTYVYGGVDFGRVDRKTMSEAGFAEQHPTLAASAQNSLFGGLTEGQRLMAGGLSTSVPLVEALAPVRSATSKPMFYVLATVPALSWLLIGIWLLRRRTRQRVLAA